MSIADTISRLGQQASLAARAGADAAEPLAVTEADAAVLADAINDAVFEAVPANLSSSDLLVIMAAVTGRLVARLTIDGRAADCADAVCDLLRQHAAGPRA